MLNNWKTVDQESDPLLHSVYDAQQSLECLIENLKLLRGNLASMAHTLQQLQHKTISAGRG